MRSLILTFFLMMTGLFSHAQSDSTTTRDSLIISKPVSSSSALEKILEDNRFLNADKVSEPLAVSEHKPRNLEFLFYSLGILLLMFGMLKTFYSRYLANLMRVFFNTSLRQSQLTDQLLQAKLPSLFFNLFFILMGGFFLFFLFIYSGYGEEGDYSLLMWCVLALALMYSVKYLTLKFSGWISGFSQETDMYIFIIFLVNKIMGIILIPVVILLAFIEDDFTYPVLVGAVIIVCLLFLFRFFRSYSLLGHRIKVSRVHFLLYIIGIEIMPVLVILKATGQLLEKS